MADSGIFSYLTTPGLNTAAPPAGAPEGMAANSFNNTLREMMANLALLVRDLPWVDLFRAYIVSRLSSNSVRIAGVDVTSLILYGSRVRLIGDTTVFGTVGTPTFTGGNTDVTIVADAAGTVPTNLLSIELSVVTYNGLPMSGAESFLAAGSRSEGRQRNYAINPEFNHWRRGTSLTASTPFTNADGSYGPDGWMMLMDGSNIASYSQETTSGLTRSVAVCRATVVTANKKFGWFMPIEYKDAVQLRGRTVSVSVSSRANTGSTIGALRVTVLQWTGTADAITRDPVSSWNAAATNPTLVTNWAYAGTPTSSHAPTDTNQVFAFQNIPISTSANNLGIFIWTEDTTTTIADWLSLGEVILNIGPLSLPFSARPVPEEQALCNRLVWSTYRENIAPADNLVGEDQGSLCIVCPSTGVPVFVPRHPVRMRIAPTVTLLAVHNGVGGTAGQIHQVETGASLANSRVLHSTEDAVRIDNNSTAAGTTGRYDVHLFATAEL